MGAAAVCFAADQASGCAAVILESLYHDIAPAAELGIPAVSINRLDERSDLPCVAELPDLRGLADALDSA